MHPLVDRRVEPHDVVHEVQPPVRAGVEIVLRERPPAEELHEVAAALAAGEDLRG